MGRRKKIKLSDFKKMKVEIRYEDVIKEYAGKTVQTLKSVSPKSNRPARKTPYFQGWESVERKGNNAYGETVWNRTNYQLTHLLEKGHFVSNTLVHDVSWAQPIPHIKPTFDKVEPQFIKAMKKVDVDVDFE